MEETKQSVITETSVQQFVGSIEAELFMDHADPKRCPNTEDSNRNWKMYLAKSLDQEKFPLSTKSQMPPPVFHLEQNHYMGTRAAPYTMTKATVFPGGQVSITTKADTTFLSDIGYGHSYKSID